MAKIGEFESMKVIKVYQLHSTAHLIDEDAFCNAFRGGDVVKAWKKDLYEHRGTLLAQDLEEAFDRASSEAKNSFGNSSLYIEECLKNYRHIEVQIIGDGKGSISHLWERECSVQ